MKLVARLKVNPAAYKLQLAGTLALPFAGRRLAQGEPLRDGELATADDGKVYRVEAEVEPLLHIECANPREAAIVGYLLGNGHAAVQIGETFLRIEASPQHEEMVRQLGVQASAVQAVFEPDLAPPAGAHHHDHHHGHHHDHGHCSHDH